MVGCWAHARRKWDEALKGLSEKEQEGSDGLIGKRYCDRLFALERAFADLSPQERHEKRLEKSNPVLDAFHKWLKSLDRPNKTALGKAIGYNLAQWKYLIRYLDDGCLEITNNRAERSIKPFVISRKNFLFANTPRGAKASAIMFSIIETAKENGLDPFPSLPLPHLHFHKSPQLGYPQQPRLPRPPPPLVCSSFLQGTTHSLILIDLFYAYSLCCQRRPNMCYNASLS